MNKYVEGLRVGISVKSLYDSDCNMTLGTIVPDYEDGKIKYYDLYNENGELACCDGEELIIDQVGEGSLTLRNDFNTVDGGTVYLTLTKDEANIAIYL